jgi:[ribosomal protein S5]-alanine N-acetyltransferase
MMGGMPELTEPALKAGLLSGRPQLVLPADGLTLRPWGVHDAPALLAAYADEGVQRWHVRSLDEDEALAWPERWADRWRRETGADWAVADGDTVLGRVGLRRLDLTDAYAEVAYWVLPAARGRGVAPRALAALTGWMFDLGFHRLELTHSVHNVASCRVADKSGYAYEGTMRGRALHADGFHDMHLHARLSV